MLALTKALPTYCSFSHGPNRAFAFVDEFFHYAHKIEVHSLHDCRYEGTLIHLFQLLDELDKVNTVHAKGAQLHWTNARSP